MSIPLTTEAAAQSESAREMESARFLIGTWQCVDTVGTHVGSYTLLARPALHARWLRLTYNWDATDDTPALSSEYFFGYDPRTRKWIRLGAMNDGMYFAMVGTREGNVWTYGYALPGPGEAVYTRKSDREFTVLGPTYP